MKKVLNVVKVLVLASMIWALTVFVSHFHYSRLADETDLSIPILPSPSTPPLPVSNTEIQLESPFIKTVELSTSNTLVLREPVTSESMARLSTKLLELSSKLARYDVVYLVLDTPGGEIDAGTKFLDTVHGIPQKVKTITLFAASMGYHIVQGLDERLITPHGTLMSHRAQIGGLAGQVPGNAVVRLNALLRNLDNMDSHISKRLGMTLVQYKEMIRDEYWVTGTDAVEQHSADALTYIRCNEDLKGTETLTVQTFFGTVEVTFAKCPAITGILEIKLAGNVIANKDQEVRSFIIQMFEDKRSFVDDYIVTGKFKQMLR